MKSALNKDSILRTLEKNKSKLKGFGVSRIGLFGSYLKGKQKKGSDLDFLVVFDKPSFDRYMGLKFYLEGLFNRKVDLVIEGNIKPAISHVIGEAAYVS